MKDYHCCATCIHFAHIKKNNKTDYFCARLGFETKPAYKFNCWEPKEHIKRLISKEHPSSY
ncbi:hypothetical protein CR194_17420 [Salipaludibacillus keqinensis]|uniref:Uncharacterized protein n=1 Tax=Salipaludibacillus keqinensis TaxID=2045207 RepID=A0A323T806_9BACI|nr:hypothetical protein [Salipaludibacillus keqinensis]PYZ91978.1 hypothetical protein CR194_17420 [Salipaludibacillus keqinensis]